MKVLLLYLSSLFLCAHAEYDDRIRLYQDQSDRAAKRPTRDLKEIFLGRCAYYQNILHLDKEEYIPKNCTFLWELFSESFTGTDECKMSASKYEKYVQAAYTAVPTHKSVFWSGVQTFMEDFTNDGKRYSVISSTFFGYVINNCNWCGTSIGGSTRTADSCTFDWKDDCNMYSFWQAASIKYADKAEGNVTLYLNGERFPIFSNRSMFFRYELPYLYQPKNAHVRVMLVLPLGKSPAESCTAPGTSIADLRKAVEAKNMTFSCHNYPLSVIHYRCIEQPDAKECRFYYDQECLVNATPGQEGNCIYNSSTALTITATALFLSWFTLFV